MDHPIRESGPRLAGLLVEELSGDGDGPLYLRISDGLKRLVDRGDVALGTVLPAERSLARGLNVSRSTVVAAYERLKRDGWLESRRGSGTWVRRPDSAPERVDAVATGRLFLTPERRIGRAAPGATVLPEDTIDLSIAALPATRAVREVIDERHGPELDELLAHHGYLPHGLPELRGSVARLLGTRGLSPDGDRIVITTGSHQAISLIARQTVQAGDSVVIESPTFPGALDIFRRFGARAIPLPVDENGARTELLEDIVLRSGARLVYLSPDFHNPTGTVMPLQRREQVAAIAQRTGITVIEDQSMAELDIDGAGLPPAIASLAPDATVLTIGSMAKLFWAGLRIGWVHTPPDWGVRMLATKTVADLGSPLLDQLLSVRLLEQCPAVRAERVAMLRPRRDTLVRGLMERLPDWRFSVPPGGLSLWVHLPSGNAEEFAEHAIEHRVAVVPGPSLSVDDGNRRALRMAYVEPESRLTEGVERLAEAWARYQPSSPRPSARLLI